MDITIKGGCQAEYGETGGAALNEALHRLSTSRGKVRDEDFMSRFICIGDWAVRQVTPDNLQEFLAAVGSGSPHRCSFVVAPHQGKHRCRCGFTWPNL